MVPLALVSLSFFIGAASASEALCTNPVYDSTDNSKGQTSCQVAETLMIVCDGPMMIYPIPVGGSYASEAPTQGDACRCNTVLYSTMSVCAACQEGTIPSWDKWIKNCAATYDNYPRDIPSNITVPKWADYPLLSDGTFDFSKLDISDSSASSSSSTHTSGSSSTSDAKGPVSTSQSSAGNSSVSVSHTVASTTGASSTLQSTSTSSSNASSLSDNSSGTISHSNTAAIAGGVVGGVLTMALIFTFVYCLYRRRSKRENFSEKVVQPFEISRHSGMALATNTTSSTYLSPRLPRSTRKPLDHLQNNETTQQQDLHQRSFEQMYKDENTLTDSCPTVLQFSDKHLPVQSSARRPPSTYTFLTNPPEYPGDTQAALLERGPQMGAFSGITS